VIPLGSLAGGALAALIGLRPTLFVGAIGGCLAFVPVLFSPVRSVRRIPEPEPEEPALEHA
jgi:predicted MFS family arabinose efflux permease